MSKGVKCIVCAENRCQPCFLGDFKEMHTPQTENNYMIRHDVCANEELIPLT